MNMPKHRMGSTAASLSNVGWLGQAWTLPFLVVVQESILLPFYINNHRVGMPLRYVSVQYLSIILFRWAAVSYQLLIYHILDPLGGLLPVSCPWLWIQILDLWTMDILRAPSSLPQA